jgi:hypothetical protein
MERLKSKCRWASVIPQNADNQKVKPKLRLTETIFGKSVVG